MTEKNSVIIDKTQYIEKCLNEVQGIWLCGMAGVGKKTAAAQIRKHHEEAAAVNCSVESLVQSVVEHTSELGKRIFYFVEIIQENEDENLETMIRTAMNRMKPEDRLIFFTEGKVPLKLLVYVWKGEIRLIYPQTLFFTENELYYYLKARKSSLDYRQVWQLTHGWPGCVALMADMQEQLPEQWTALQLCSRYEIRQFIREYILKKLSLEEYQLIAERASFPMINKALSEQLFEKNEADVEERLFLKGIMNYVPEKEYWYIWPVICLCIDKIPNRELCLKAVQWYETHGWFMEALKCSKGLGVAEFRQCLIRNYDKISFMAEEIKDKIVFDAHVPELFYLWWMELLFDQKFIKMDKYQKKAFVRMKSAEKSGEEIQKWREIYLNMTFSNPRVQIRDWMQLLQTITTPETPIRLYYLLGDSFSYLSGIRDLSPLFACGEKERETYEELWYSRLAPECHTGFALAKLEYDYQTDRLKHEIQWARDVMSDIGENSPWQERLGKMYMLYVFADENEYQSQLRAELEELKISLFKEESPICRYNAKALYYLTEAKWGEKEDIICWLREKDGDIGNKSGRTAMQLMAQIKIHLYLGNYRRADQIISRAAVYFQQNFSYKYMAETLFQKAITEKEKGNKSEALKCVEASLKIAEPFKYVRIYTTYGEQGYELLKMYSIFLFKQSAAVEERYTYGDVFRMSYEQWVHYIIRRAKHYKKRPILRKGQTENIFFIEKLTLTEKLVLQYIGEGRTNTQISEQMNIKVTTVKSHFYHICKKLGVSTRLEAVNMARQMGLI